MAAKKLSRKDGQRHLAALNLMAGDGLSLPSEDLHHLEVLIDDNSESELRSEWGEEEVNSLNILFTITLNTTEYGTYRIVSNYGRASSNFSSRRLNKTSVY